MAKNKIEKFSEQNIDRIVEMAWEDRTPFDAIEAQYGLAEPDLIKLMQKEMKPKSFKMWRKRVRGRSTKHLAKRNPSATRFKSKNQKNIGS